MTARKQQFLQDVTPLAIEIGNRYGLDPKLIIAQAAQETGWGRSVAGNNYFGIKSHGQGGGKNVVTHEYINGKRVKITDRFREYGGLRDSMEGYANFLKSNPRYADVFRQKGLVNQANAIAKAGYATDPNYARSLINIGGNIKLPQTAQQAIQIAAPIPQNRPERMAFVNQPPLPSLALDKRMANFPVDSDIPTLRDDIAPPLPRPRPIPSPRRVAMASLTKQLGQPANNDLSGYNKLFKTKPASNIRTSPIMANFSSLGNLNQLQPPNAAPRINRIPIPRYLPPRGTARIANDFTKANNRFASMAGGFKDMRSNPLQLLGNNAMQSPASRTIDRGLKNIFLGDGKPTTNANFAASTGRTLDEINTYRANRAARGGLSIQQYRDQVDPNYLRKRR